MSTVAQKFIQELQKGDQTQAIETIKESLRENAYNQIEEKRQEVLESYGFVLKESTKANQDAKKVENELKRQGVDYYKDVNTGYVSFEMEDYPGVNIVVDGVGIKVTEMGSEEYYDDFNSASVSKAVKLVQEG